LVAIHGADSDHIMVRRNARAPGKSRNNCALLPERSAHCVLCTAHFFLLHLGEKIIPEGIGKEQDHGDHKAIDGR
jgi:hypothetical protein